MNFVHWSFIIVVCICQVNILYIEGIKIWIECNSIEMLASFQYAHDSQRHFADGEHVWIFNCNRQLWINIQTKHDDEFYQYLMLNVIVFLFMLTCYACVCFMFIPNNAKQGYRLIINHKWWKKHYYIMHYISCGFLWFKSKPLNAPLQLMINRYLHL